MPHHSKIKLINIVFIQFIHNIIFSAEGIFQAGKLIAAGFVCLFVLLLYIPSQQLWSWRDGQFTKPHFNLGKLEQAVNQ